MRFTVEPSPRGGYAVRLAGHDAPVSHHDTEEEAHERAAAYERGLGTAPAEPGAAPPRFVGLAGGTQVLVRGLTRADGPLLAGLCDDLSFLPEIDYVDREGLAALDPGAGTIVAIIRYTRRRDDDRTAVTVCNARAGWRERGIEAALRTALAARARANGIDRLM